MVLNLIRAFIFLEIIYSGMPGGNAPQTKKRKRGDRREKEKPLLAVQGLLRLEHCFQKPNNDEAEVIEVQVGDEKKKIVLAPDEMERSEHDMVGYKLGYETGPLNPLPQDEREEQIFAKKRVLEKADEYFEEMKKETEEKREEREAAWAEAEMTEAEKRERAEKRKAKRAAKRATEEAKKLKDQELDLSAYGYAADDNPDNPDNYQAPSFDDLKGGVNVFGSMVPIPTSSDMREVTESELKAPGDDEEENIQEPEKGKIVHTEGNTRVVVLKAKSNDDDDDLEDLPKVTGPEVMEKLDDDMQKEYDDGENDEDVTNKNIVDMATAVALKMEEKRRNEEWEKQTAEIKKAEMRKVQAEADALAREAERSELSIDELTTLRQLEAKLGLGQGQSQGPMIPAAAAQGHRQALDAYWEFVRENPQDFNGWVYLIQACETVDIMDEIRTVYNAFLPLFPYCYAYWKRYSDIERKGENWSRSLAILHRGLAAIPLSVDLWVAYLELYYKMYSTHQDFPALYRDQCEKALATAGLEYRSDVLWETVIEKESAREEYRYVTDLFRRILSIPTKLYNKHWDNFIAHVRDHHPRDILQYPDYESLRKLTCRELGLTYRPDPISNPGEQRKVELPEDKLKAGMKERLVASMVSTHEKTEKMIDDIYKFEEKLKRTYFHVKPLDQKQLRVWDQYLDWQVAQGDHQRTVVLFERCLIPCALYEQYWAKYARYLERAYREGRDRTGPGVTWGEEECGGVIDTDIGKARNAFGTGLGTVDQLRQSRCTWTLRGWKETLKDGSQVMRAEVISEEELQAEAEADQQRAQVGFNLVKDTRPKLNIKTGNRGT